MCAPPPSSLFVPFRPFRPPFVRMVFVLIGCFCSGFAGVYFEKMMKKPASGAGGKKASMWVNTAFIKWFYEEEEGLHVGACGSRDTLHYILKH